MTLTKQLQWAGEGASLTEVGSKGMGIEYLERAGRDNAFKKLYCQ